MPLTRTLLATYIACRVLVHTMYLIDAQFSVDYNGTPVDTLTTLAQNADLVVLQVPRRHTLECILRQSANKNVLTRAVSRSDVPFERWIGR